MEGVAAIILAAGYPADGRTGGQAREEESGRESSAGPDALRPVDGGGALSVVLRTLAAVPLHEVLVVLGRDAALVRQRVSLEGVTVVEMPESVPMIDSIRAGLEALPPSAGVLIWPVNRALVAIKTVRALLSAHGQGALIAVPACAVPGGEEGRRGHPVLFDRALFPELRAAPDSQGAAAVVHAHASDVVEVPVEDRGILVDVGAPATKRLLATMRSIAKELRSTKQRRGGPEARARSPRRRRPSRPN